MLSYTTEGSDQYQHDTVCIFTDGAITQGHSSGSCVIGLLDESGDSIELKNIRAFSKYHDDSTNNIAELQGVMLGIMKALEYYKSTSKHTYSLLIFSDSEYCIKSLTEWVFGWYKTYTETNKNGIVFPSMMTKGGTKVKNAELICAIIHYIVANEQYFTDISFVNVKGHTWNKGNPSITEQMEYYKTANNCDITEKEAVFICKYNHIVDRIAVLVSNHIKKYGIEDVPFFENDGTPCLKFTEKDMHFTVYDSVNDEKLLSKYYVLNKAIMKSYRAILQHLPF